jgi:predicted deacylase
MIIQTILTPFRLLARWPKKYTIPGVISIVLVVIIGVMMLPRSVEFSYSQATCVDQPVVLPGVFKSIDSNDFAIETHQSFNVAGVALVAKGVCIKPLTPPKTGDHQVAFAPFGMWVGSKSFNVTVNEPPVASTKSFELPVPVSRPLKVALSTTDTVFSYQLSVDNRAAPCANSGSVLQCDVEKLSLKQGSEYEVTLDRYFSKNKVKTLSKKTIKTLSATTVTTASIKKDETIYSKPQTIQIGLDKPIVRSKATLVRIQDGNKTVVPSKTVATGNTVDITWEEQLARTATYELTLGDIEAKDGSSLIEPFVVPFKTSGGPKVTAVNIPKFGVAVGSTAVIQFDQPLLDSQDLSGMVKLNNAPIAATRSGKTLSISLAALPKCADFSIALSKDIKSNFDIGGDSAWAYSARTLCHTVGTFGYSAKGRAMNAYYFGDGPVSALFTGAIHGDERSTKSLMDRWVQDLESKARDIPAGTSVVVVPMINPDGFANGSRTNANNVDLNRNFGTSDWKKDITTVTNKPFPGGGGNAPMSEPETRAIASLVSRLRPKVVLSYHSIGGVVAANQAGSSGALARTYSAISGYGNATGSSTTFEYAISGTADDYYAEKLGIASILIELGSHSYHQFERNQKAMWAMLK